MQVYALGSRMGSAAISGSIDDGPATVFNFSSDLQTNHTRWLRVFKSDTLGHQSHTLHVDVTSLNTSADVFWLDYITFMPFEAQAGESIVVDDRDPIVSFSHGWEETWWDKYMNGTGHRPLGRGATFELEFTGKRDSYWRASADYWSIL